MIKWVWTAILVALCSPANADEISVSVFGGGNTGAHTVATLSEGTSSQTDTVGWQGYPFRMPAYYGVRATYWPDALRNWGFALDFTHAKTYADIADPDIAESYDRLEFSDGLNLLTLNAIHRFDATDTVNLYAGVGAGLSIPHVEIETTPGSAVGATSTIGYQLTGGTVQALAGLRHQFTDRFSGFAEYRLARSFNEAALSGGGSWSGAITTNHISVGLSVTFGGDDTWPANWLR